MLKVESLSIHGREYERRQRRKNRETKRWTYRPNKRSTKRVWVPTTSLLHHALEELARAKRHIHALERALQSDPQDGES